MSPQSQLESILFVASKPLSTKKLAKVLKLEEKEVLSMLNNLAGNYKPENSGIVLVNNGHEWQLVSNPSNKEATENFVKAEVSGDLTRPQLETLTVISYCGPITKPELEQIRGVNCSLILRNLMLRGLVKEIADTSALLPKFEVTMDYVRNLGITSLEQLPDYSELHEHEYLSNDVSASEA
jgi:segregation and condensation protein B